MVISGASLYMMGLSSSNNKEKKTDLQSQRSKQRSWSLALKNGYIWWMIHGQCYRCEDNAMSLVMLTRGRQEKVQDYEKARR